MPRPYGHASLRARVCKVMKVYKTTFVKDKQIFLDDKLFLVGAFVAIFRHVPHKCRKITIDSEPCNKARVGEVCLGNLSAT